MKRIFIAAIIATATLAGCSKEENSTSTTGMTLTVNVDESPASKATIGDDWKFSFKKGDYVRATNTEYMRAGSDPYGNVGNYDFVKGETSFTSSDAKTTTETATWYAFFPNREFYLTGQTGTKDNAADHFGYIGSQANVPAHTKTLNITMSPQMSIIKIVNNKGGININAKAPNGEYLWYMQYDNKTASYFVKTWPGTVINILEASKIGTYYIAVPSQYAFDIYDGTTKLREISATSLVAGKYYTLTIAGSTTKSEALTGSFTVSDGNQVRFSRGNLWYDNSTWLFETNQYDVYGSAYEKYHVSNFFYEKAGNYGSEAKYTGDQTCSSVDWGVPYCEAHSYSAGTWRTLSIAEWKYLLESRTDAAQKVGFATVAGMQGLIILPDSFTDPKTNTSSKSVNKVFVPKSTTGWDANIYTAGADWNAMEAAGAVFLPAANHRSSSSPIGTVGRYWTTTVDIPYKAASYLDFTYTVIATTGKEYCSTGSGFSVRLVTGVN